MSLTSKGHPKGQNVENAFFLNLAAHKKYTPLLKYIFFGML
jgi:hypothetical protein